VPLVFERLIPNIGRRKAYATANMRANARKQDRFYTLQMSCLPAQPVSMASP